ncbi:hypothetical protein CR513_14149, partial [Mucuna pruriens]
LLLTRQKGWRWPDLLNIKQTKSESLRQYLHNSLSIRPESKCFVKAFQKGLMVGPFSDSLALRNLASMGEIWARVKKHIEVKKDWPTNSK